MPLSSDNSSYNQGWMNSAAHLMRPQSTPLLFFEAFTSRMGTLSGRKGVAHLIDEKSVPFSDLPKT